MRQKKHQQQEHDDSHRWVVSYADFITLLFAFFVVMYAISSVNISKYKSLSEGMHSAFNQKDKHRSVKSTSSEADGPVDLKSLGGDRQHFDEMNLALSQMQNSTFKVNKENGKIQIDMRAGSLFNEGSADLHPAAMMTLMEIAGTINHNYYPVVVAGYTDNQPISTPQYPSNWELSTARASSVARALIAFGVDPSRIMVIGYADQYPIADNITPEGRERNRRVNLLISEKPVAPRVLVPEMHQQKSDGVKLPGLLNN